METFDAQAGLAPAELPADQIIAALLVRPALTANAQPGAVVLLVDIEVQAGA